MEEPEEAEALLEVLPLVGVDAELLRGTVMPLGPDELEEETGTVDAEPVADDPEADPEADAPDVVAKPRATTGTPLVASVNDVLSAISPACASSWHDAEAPAIAQSTTTLLIPSGLPSELKWAPVGLITSVAVRGGESMIPVGNVSTILNTVETPSTDTWLATIAAVGAPSTLASCATPGM